MSEWNWGFRIETSISNVINYITFTWKNGKRNQSELNKSVWKSEKSKCEIEYFVLFIVVERFQLKIVHLEFKRYRKNRKVDKLIYHRRNQNRENDPIAEMYSSQMHYKDPLLVVCYHHFEQVVCILCQQKTFSSVLTDINVLCGKSHIKCIRGCGSEIYHCIRSSFFWLHHPHHCWFIVLFYQ